MITNGFNSGVRLSVLLLIFLGGSGPTFGQRTAIESDLPVYGIGARQVFRFAVATAGEQPDPSLDADQRCQATLSFRDTQNRPIGMSLDVDLGSNEAAFHDLDARTLGLRGRQRIDFRPVLSPTPESGPCSTSFSILDGLTGALSAQGDSSGQSSELLEPACSDLNQAFGILLPPIGAGQTLQLTAVRSSNPVDVNNAPLPCDVIVHIRPGGPATAPVATLVTGALGPGQAASVTVPFKGLHLPVGETAFLGQEVLAFPTSVHFPGFEAPCSASTNCGCTISAQVIDDPTRATIAIWTP